MGSNSTSTTGDCGPESGNDEKVAKPRERMRDESADPRGLIPFLKVLCRNDPHIDRVQYLVPVQPAVKFGLVKVPPEKIL